MKRVPPRGMATETAKRRSKGSRRKLAAAALALSAPIVQAAPTEGQVVPGSGTGSISQSGTTTTITQTSPNLSLNWKSFNVAPNETVTFAQPSAAAIAVNRIFDTSGTQILGRLNANGQVWLINPNGILFGQGAQVNVAGLVASTLDFNDATMGSNARSFSGNGTGRVINQGTIQAADGGYVALLGKEVRNQGTISARLGSVALGAGSAATLTFSGNSLVKMQVDQSVLDSLAENGGLIRADGGTVIMSAGARDALLASVVNNTGVIEARTVEDRAGTIILLGGMAAGQVNVGGTLNASAPNGGNGGFIETSAAHVKIADDARITTVAPQGKSGGWLIDPTDFTIAAGSGAPTTSGIGAQTLSDSLNNNGSVTIATNASGTDPGDIHVNGAVNWSSDATLTLNADRNINVNADITATGNNAGLVLSPNTANGGVYSLNNGAKITLSGATPTLSIAGVNYTVINSASALQSMGTAGNYALGGDIDASATGFTPVGNYGTPFTGVFDGLGHVISKLTIDGQMTYGAGLFGWTDSGSEIRNVGLVDAEVNGVAYVGSLVAYNSGTIRNSYAIASVSSGTSIYIGGLVGFNSGTISGSYATSNVSANDYTNVGGLVGGNSGTISNSYATGNVSYLINSNQSYVGGLVGWNHNGATISNSYAAVTVDAPLAVSGGLAGTNDGTISGSYWNSDVIAAGVGQGSGTVTATDLSSTAMQLSNNFPTLDFNNTWTIYERNTAPLLRSFMRPLTVTAINATKVYDGQPYVDPYGVTYSISNPDLTQLSKPSYIDGNGNSCANTSCINAGTYSIMPDLYSTQRGYIITPVAGALTITQRPVDLTGSRVYDGTQDVSSGIFTPRNLVLGESLTLSGMGRVASKNVGTQNLLSLGSLALNDCSSPNCSGLATNYILNGGTYTANITPATLTLTAASDTRVYNGDPSSTGVVNISGLVGGDTAKASQVFDSRNVGARTLTPALSGPVNDGNRGQNYTVNIVTAAGSITPATLTYTATPASFFTGQAPHNLSGAVTGFAPGDTLAESTTGVLTWSTPAGPPSPPGRYAINGSGLSSVNYVFAQDAGNATALTVQPGLPLQPVRHAVAHLESEVLPSMESAVPEGKEPLLQIINGGIRLPASMVNANE